MNCVESRRVGPIDPPPLPSRLRVTIFSSRLLGLMSVINILVYLYWYDIVILCTLSYYGAGSVLAYMHQVQMGFVRISNP